MPEFNTNRAEELASLLEHLQHIEVIADVIKYLRASKNVVEQLTTECGGWVALVRQLLHSDAAEVRMLARTMVDDIGFAGVIFNAEAVARRELIERLTKRYLDGCVGAWCGLDCGRFIFLYEDKYFVVDLDEDRRVVCCAECHASNRSEV